MYKRQAKGGTTTRPEDAKSRKRREAEQRQALSKKRKVKQDVIDKLEAKISAIEKRQVEITSQLELPETYTDGGQAQQLNRELMEINDKHDCYSDEGGKAVDDLNAIG